MRFSLLATWRFYNFRARSYERVASNGHNPELDIVEGTIVGRFTLRATDVTRSPLGRRILQGNASGVFAARILSVLLHTTAFVARIMTVALGVARFAAAIITLASRITGFATRIITVVREVTRLAARIRTVVPRNHALRRGGTAESRALPAHGTYQWIPRNAIELGGRPFDASRCSPLHLPDLPDLFVGLLVLLRAGILQFGGIELLVLRFHEKEGSR